MMASVSTGTAGGTGTGTNGNTSDSTLVTTATAFTDTTARNISVTLILVLLWLATLGFNIAFLVLYNMVRRLQIPPNYLLVSLAVADMLSAIFWITPAIVTSSTWAWILGEQFCKFHGTMSTFFYAVNVTNLLAITLERFMKFWSPSRHRLTFSRKVTLILLVSLWIFSIVFAIMPLIGWGQFEYVEPRFHCIMNFGKSFSLLNFFTITAYGIPMLLGLVFLIVIFVKVKCSKKDPIGDVILEDRSDRPNESYAERLKRQEEKYQNVATRKTKPKIGKKHTRKESPVDDGYNSGVDDKTKNDMPDELDTDDSDLDWKNSDDEEYYLDYMDAINQRRELERRTLQKRRFRLHQREVSMTVTLAIVWGLFMVLWLPYMVINYPWVYTYYPGYYNEHIHTAFTLLAFVSVAYKPLMYATNRYMRKTVQWALERRRIKKRLRNEQDRAYSRQQHASRNIDDQPSRGRYHKIRDREGNTAETQT